MATIDYFYTVLSPFTYLAGDRLERIAAAHGAVINYKPVDVASLLSRTGGVPLPQRHEARKEYRVQELTRIAAAAGMPFNLNPAHWPTNPAPAAYAVIAAQKAGGGDVGALVRGLLAACWAEEKDVAEDEVVKGCLAAAGFDPSLADSGLLVGAEEYAQNLEEAVNRGAFGSPFYIVAEDDARFWGQDRLDALEAHLAGRSA